MIDEIIIEYGRKALVEEVLGVPLRSFGSVKEWLEKSKDYAKVRLPDSISWDEFTDIFAAEIEDVFQEHRVFLDLFPGYSLDDMAEDMERLSIRKED